MRINLKQFFLVVVLFTVIIILMLYSFKHLNENNRFNAPVVDTNNEGYDQFDSRLKKLEESLDLNHQEVSNIKHAIRNLIRPNATNINVPPGQKYQSRPKSIVDHVIYADSCPFQVRTVPTPDVQMMDMYERLSFDNPDGGVWKQGFRIEVDAKDWNAHNKLHVFVVPHSHNDPGWIKTFDEYYLNQTKHVLNNMLRKLPEEPRRKFIWAEISFFSLWWDGLSDDERESVKKLVENKQLEIVSGGWVMNDEANSHWIAVVGQMIEGHQWLQQNLNFTPENSWSIDPYGLSMAQPALLKEMGLKNMVIQRVHYSVKKELARKQQLEFQWRQIWDGTGASEMMTHMMPFFSYDIPYTCGPDPKVCCQFDFKRLPGHGLHCPWKIAPVSITKANVAQRVELLLDQYRKKSKLFKTNVLLVPLGDDFRYDDSTEWDAQYENYQKLFDYMNANQNLNVHAQFGTLSDYFQAVRKFGKETRFPSLSGDFFTYADRDDHYWSGYYTSQPFYKRMDRILMSYIRSAEVILTMAYMSGKPGSNWMADSEVGLEKQLSDARKSLALFQHHDGITGTARDHVIVDYGNKLLKALISCQHVIQHSTHILLNGKDAETPDKNSLFYNIDDVYTSHNVNGEKYLIKIGPELRKKRVAIFNSQPYARVEVVNFHVSTPFIEVLDMKGKRITCQVSPFLERGATISQGRYQLAFIANIPALGITSFIINAVSEHDELLYTFKPKLVYYNYNHFEDLPSNVFDSEAPKNADEFTLLTDRLNASFSKAGLLKSMNVNGETIPVHLDFASYGVKARKGSGANLFLPYGKAVRIPIENRMVQVMRGPILSSVTVELPYLRHTVTLYNTMGADGVGIEIENLVDITKTNNFDLVMRFSTNINSSDTFYTDVNALEMVKRKRFKKLPLQANCYPMPSMAYIEDEKTRLTLLTGSPLGVSSLTEGELEVMLDRTFHEDDEWGLGQGVTDNVHTRHVFRVLLEQKPKPCKASAEGHPSGFPSLAAHVALQSLHNPMVRLLRSEDNDVASKNSYVINAENSNSDFGVDFVLASLRTGVTLKGRNYVGIILHRQFVDVCFSDGIQLNQFPLSNGNVNVGDLLLQSNEIIFKTQLFKTSLSFMYMKEVVDVFSDFAMCPMEIQAFVLQR